MAELIGCATGDSAGLLDLNDTNPQYGAMGSGATLWDHLAILRWVRLDFFPLPNAGTVISEHTEGEGGVIAHEAWGILT